MPGRADRPVSRDPDTVLYSPRTPAPIRTAYARLAANVGDDRQLAHAKIAALDIVDTALGSAQGSILASLSPELTPRTAERVRRFTDAVNRYVTSITDHDAPLDIRCAGDPLTASLAYPDIVGQREDKGRPIPSTGDTDVVDEAPAGLTASVVTVLEGRIAQRRSLTVLGWNLDRSPVFVDDGLTPRLARPDERVLGVETRPTAAARRYRW